MWALLPATKVNLLVGGAILLVMLAVFTWWVLFSKKERPEQKEEN